MSSYRHDWKAQPHYRATIDRDLMQLLCFLNKSNKALELYYDKV